MTRISKQASKRAISPRRTKGPFPKTGTKKDALPKGYKEHENALPNQTAVFIPKIK